MRLRTLPLSLAGVVYGGFLAYADSDASPWTLVMLFLTTVSLQILSNLSNELGDHLSGVDGEGREGPNYSMADGGLTVKQMWHSINAFVIICAISGLLMLLFSFQFSVFNFQFLILLALGVAAIWAATHYTLGKNPYGYKGLGDLFVFIFFGLVSVLGSYFVVAHNIEAGMILPAVGCGLLSVAVLNVNNIRDMASDDGIRKTIPLRIGALRAKIYQSFLVVVGYACYFVSAFHYSLTNEGVHYWPVAIMVLPFALHFVGVWRRNGKALDPMLPLLVLSTFFLSVVYIVVCYGI